MVGKSQRVSARMAKRKQQTGQYTLKKVSKSDKLVLNRTYNKGGIIEEPEEVKVSRPVLKER
jgi:hypothetical protein